MECTGNDGVRKNSKNRYSSCGSAPLVAHLPTAASPWPHRELLTYLAFQRPSLTEDMNIVMPLTFGSGTAVTCTVSRNMMPALYCTAALLQASQCLHASALGIMEAENMLQFEP